MLTECLFVSAPHYVIENNVKSLYSPKQLELLLKEQQIKFSEELYKRMLDKSELPTEQEDAHDALSIMVDKKFDHIYNLFEMKTHCVVTCTICHHVVVSPNEY